MITERVKLMLMSAVLDPSAFDVEDLDEFYMIQVEDFLQGVWRNGVLIVDSERKLQEELFKKAESLPIKGNRLRTLLTDLLKEKSKRVAVPSVSPSNVSSVDLLDLTCHLKRDTEPDGLIVGDENFEKLRFDPEHRHSIVPLSEYRDSDFEKERQGYCDGLGPIDAYSRLDVDKIIIRSIRFTKWLRFYDKQIGTGNNTSNFRRGIAYILSLWKEHGFFASQQGIGTVEIFTCRDEHISDDDIDDVNRKINRELMEQLREQFPSWWQIKLSVKDDPNGIFHARYLETQHAIIRVDRGFALFKQNGSFWRNFFTLNMAESSHLRECRGLPKAD
ncbi:hypothetical protein F4X10_16970 [Candidatus Poribacteria bacterium]|nr:hypothetical protein [Candidatus Poribacteria bacterium]